MLKNWIVKTKQIKNGASGLIRYANYVLDSTRPAHAKTRIVELGDVQQGATNTLAESELRKARRRKLGKRGGGVRNLATSFALSLPKDIPQPTPKQWRSIAAEAVKAIAVTNGLDPRLVWKNSSPALHIEHLKSKNSHLHLVVSNIHGGEYVKGITQLKTTYAVKQAFNRAVKRELGVSNTHYQPKKSNCGNKPLWVARAEKAEALESDFQNTKKLFRQYFDQLRRWANYVVENNKNRERSTEKRIEKTARRIEAMKEYTAKNEAIADYYDVYLKQIEENELLVRKELSYDSKLQPPKR